MAADLDAGADRLGNPLLVPFRVLPFAGRQLQSAHSLADAASDAVDAAIDAIDEGRAVLDAGVEEGEPRVRALQTLARIAATTRSAIDELELGPSGDQVVAPLREARADLEAEQAEISDLLGRIEQGAAGLAHFVGGPSRFLVLAANNSQMQNGSGMFLSWGILEATGGHLDLSPMTTINQLALPETPIPIDPGFRTVFGFMDPNTDWRHLGATARFPVTAGHAAAMWEATGGGAVDGVIVIDPFVLEALLDDDFSIAVDEGTITRDTLVPHLLNGQYQGLPFDGLGDENTERRAELSEIARDAIDTLDGRAELDAEFLDDLAAVARERHLLMWSRHDDIQTAFAAAGTTGELGADSLSLGVLNRSGVKLDWFIDVRATLSASPSGGGRQRLTVELANGADVDQPRYVVGPFPGSGLERGEYLGLAVVSLPVGAEVVAVEPADALVSAGMDGDHPTVTARVQPAAGGSAGVAIEFTTPVDEVEIEAAARARPIRWSVRGKTWNDGAPHRVRLRTQT